MLECCVPLAAIDPIGAVMAFGVVSVLLWFLLNALNRGHKTRIQRLRITIEEIRQEEELAEDLDANLEAVLALLVEAEQAGPFKGRRPLSAAHGAMAALIARLETDQEVILGK